MTWLRTTVVPTSEAMIRLTPEEDRGLRLLARLLVRAYLKDRPAVAAAEQPTSESNEEDPSLAGHAV